MKHTKRILSVIYLILTGINVFAQNDESPKKINWFTYKPNIELQAGITFTDYEIKPVVNTGFETSILLDMKEFIAFQGFSISENKFDITTNIRYSPTIYENFSIGPKLIFHESFYFDEYFDFDFLIGAYAKFDLLKTFSYDLAYYYHLKDSIIYEIKDYCPNIINNTQAFETSFCFKPIEKLQLFFKLSSFSEYSYYLFLAPDFSTGIKYDFMQKLSAKLTFDVQYIDMLTLSANLNTFRIKLEALWRL